LSGGKASESKENEDDLGLFEPKKDEFKELAKGLKFLKFSPDEAEARRVHRPSLPHCASCRLNTSWCPVH
jgi:hypothetical protein